MQVGRADENAVHAFHRGDFLEVVEALLVLDLNEHTELLVGAFRVILHARKARRPRPAGDAAQARGRIARVGDRAFRFVGVLHVGNQDRLRADIQEPLDRHHVVPGDADHGVRGVGRCGLQLLQHRFEIVGRMLGVEQYPVEARARHELGRVVRRQAAPQADLPLACFQRVLEGVGGKFHVYVYTL